MISAKDIRKYWYKVTYRRWVQGQMEKVDSLGKWMWLIVYLRQGQIQAKL